MRGRKPIPNRLKVLRGTARADQLHNEPEPDTAAPICPAWLDDAAKAKWAELLPHLKAMGLLTIIDGDALAAYCQAWSEFQWATETLQKEGRTQRKGTGLSAHPAVQQQRTAWRAIRDFAALFGLSPADRSRLDVAPHSEEDEFVEFLRGIGDAGSVN
jgi:P27 family predicted phage terminase small subunit